MERLREGPPRETSLPFPPIIYNRYSQNKFYNTVLGMKNKEFIIDFSQSFDIDLKFRIIRCYCSLDRNQNKSRLKQIHLNREREGGASSRDLSPLPSFHL